MEGCNRRNDPIDWNAFEEWLLKDHRKQSAIGIMLYAKEYGHCLEKMDLSDVRDLRESLRPNVLKALSNLSKFLGCYQEYKTAIKNFGLSWGGRSADDVIIDRLTKIQDPGEVFDWIREVKKARPELSAFIDFNAITGLRLQEAIDSFNLIIKLSREGKLHEYYNEKQGTLEHFKFKEIFIRKSKKAFISFIPEDQLRKVIEDFPLKSKASVQQLVRKRGLKLRFADLREAHATFLTKHLNASEIDFLHGRVNTNVFMANYFNPALIEDLKDRMFKAIQDIQTRIS